MVDKQLRRAMADKTPTMTTKELRKLNNIPEPKKTRTTYDAIIAAQRSRLVDYASDFDMIVTPGELIMTVDYEPPPEPILIPIDLNNGNAGQTKHWGSSHKLRDEYEELIRAMGLVRTPPDYKQRVVVTRILGKGQRLWDPDSILRGSAKQLIDALTSCGWWNDDSSKWLESVDGRQDDTQRDNGPAVKIEAHKEIPNYDPI